MTPRKNAATTRGRPFAPGNSGRPKGAKHKVTQAMEALLQGEHEALTRKAIELALAGDTVALRLCFERLAPAPKDRAVAINLPAIEGIGDLLGASSAVVDAVAAGAVTPGEGTSVMALLSAHKAIMESVDLEARIAALEACSQNRSLTK